MPPPSLLPPDLGPPSVDLTPPPPPQQKHVARLRHPQHFLDAVLCADSAPKSIDAVGSRSDGAFFVFSHRFPSNFIPAPFEVMCL